MNGSMVNDRLIKGGYSIVLKNGDILTFGQDPQQYLFQYEQSGPTAEQPTAFPPPLLVDDRVSLVNSSRPTYARVDHLAQAPVPAHKAALNVRESNKYVIVYDGKHRELRRKHIRE